MLLAEIYGHAIPEVQDNEDYLTSEVFGHLRYLPPHIFWNELFSHAVRRTPEGIEVSLSNHLRSCYGLSPSDYSSLLIHFWPRHNLYGIPDLALCFESSSRPPLVVLVEAKLWAGKSGTGPQDQLVQYLNILDDLSGLDLEICNEKGHQAYSFLLYLTPHESLPEVLESARVWDERRPGFERLYRVQWQDIARASRTITTPIDRLSTLVLADISKFLGTRGLEYFVGFGQKCVLQCLETDGEFYGTSDFAGFSALTLPELGATLGRFYGDQPCFSGFRQSLDIQAIRQVRGGWI